MKKNKIPWDSEPRRRTGTIGCDPVIQVLIKEVRAVEQKIHREPEVFRLQRIS